MVLNYAHSTYFGHGMFIQDIDLLSMSVFCGLAKQSDINEVSPSPALAISHSHVRCPENLFSI